MHNKDQPWFDDQCRRSFGLQQEAHLRRTRDRSRVKWEEFVLCRVRAKETHVEGKRQFCVINWDVMNAQYLHKWWSPLMSAVLGSSSSHNFLRLLVGVVDWCSSLFIRLNSLNCCQIILAASSPGSLDLPLTCHLFPSLSTFAYRSNEVRRLLLDFYPYGGTDT